MVEWSSVTPQTVRPWLILGAACISFAAAFIWKTPGLLGLAGTLFGIEPLARAHDT